MNNRKLLIVISLVLSTTCFSQQEGRKGKFLFNLGPEFRITPIYYSGTSGISEENFDNTIVDLQNSGIAVNIGVDYYITEKLAIGFSNSFRYDLTNIRSTLGEGIEGPNKQLLIGSHFRLSYHINLFKKGDLLISLGHSLLNRNSEYSFTRPVFDTNGSKIGTTSTLLDFNYSATKISVGYGNGKSKLFLGMYASMNTPYFYDQRVFMVPFLSYGFDFGRL